MGKGKLDKLEQSTLVEVVPGRVYYAASTRPPSYGFDMVEQNNLVTHMFSTDHSLVYWNFFLDFGPLNLGQVYRFIEAMDAKLATVKADRVIYYSAPVGQRQANSVFLMGAYALLRLGRTAEEAFAPFRAMKLPPFHDATQTVCTYRLTVLDCLRGMEHAMRCGFLDLANFDIDSYEHFEKVENGDMSWVFPGRFVAFAGPHESKSYDEMYPTCVPEDYHEHFLANNVRTVVRLNKKYYDENRFKTVGIHLEDLYYPDGSCPNDDVLARFLEICESRPGHAIAVHCKAGLGRTGTCIGAYAMKHWGFTAAEVIGWMRVVRPGSVIGPQQQYLESIEARMHSEGGHVRRSILAPASPTSSAPLDAVVRSASSGLPFSVSVKHSLSHATASSASTAESTTTDEGDEDRDPATQGDHLLYAKMSSPGAPKTRHSLMGGAASGGGGMQAVQIERSASSRGSAGSPPNSPTSSFSALRSAVSRKWYGGARSSTAPSVSSSSVGSS